MKYTVTYPPVKTNNLFNCTEALPAQAQDANIVVAKGNQQPQDWNRECPLLLCMQTDGQTYHTTDN
jgi:hypothetical protein